MNRPLPVLAYLCADDRPYCAGPALSLAEQDGVIRGALHRHPYLRPAGTVQDWAPGRPVLAAVVGRLGRGSASGLIAARVTSLVDDHDQLRRLYNAARVGGWLLLPLDAGVLHEPSVGLESLARQLQGDLIREGMAAGRRNGRIPGRRPCPEWILDEVLVRHRAGLTQGAIAAALSTAGIPTPSGRQNWSRYAVSRLLASSRARWPSGRGVH